jgi:hypothetical protein
MYLRSVLLLDFDNLWTALDKERPAAARRFTIDPQGWVAAIEDGSLIPLPAGEVTRRRILSLRCYANPDLMFRLRCRTAFVRAGFSVVDCPSLTAAGKNSADIHMVLDAVDLLEHPTRFDEFIILSADADFTPLLTRLRMHDRRTVVFSTFTTAGAYKAVATALLPSDALSAHLAGEAEGRGGGLVRSNGSAAQRPAAVDSERVSAGVSSMVQGLRQALAQSTGAIPLAQAAQVAAAAVQNATQDWGGTGSFRKMLTPHLGGDLQISIENDILYDPGRHTPGARAASLLTLSHVDLPEDYRELALRLRSVLDCPVLSPADMRRVFAATADIFGNDEVFDANTLSKTVRDRLKETERPVARGPIQFILKGVQLAGFEAHHLRTPAALAAAYAASLARTCLTAGVELTAAEIALLQEWLGADAPDAPAPDDKAEP